MRVLVTGGSGFIGTNLVADALARGHDVTSLDLRPPKIDGHRALWRELDVTDLAAVTELVRVVAPDAIVHLAARADTDSNSASDYEVNVSGTRVVAEASATNAVERLIHTSTQYVFTLGRNPMHDEDYAPFTAYGESKVQSEQVLRQREWPFIWTIVRPTNVWGPWHPRYPNEFWKIVSRGLYVHPGCPPVRRAYGYVGNVSQQILAMIAAPRETVAGRTFYVGDDALWLDAWVDAFHVALRGRPARRVPLPLLRAVARAGDALQAMGLKAPLTTSRLRNMIEEHVAPMEQTLETFGPPAYDLEAGVRQTVEWLSQAPAVERSRGA